MSGWTQIVIDRLTGRRNITLDADYTVTGDVEVAGTLTNNGEPVGSGDSSGVKRYVALLTQSGTDAPVATVMENSLGGELVWSYSAAGIYIATLVGAFPVANKLFAPNLVIADSANVVIRGMGLFQWNDADSIFLISVSGQIDGQGDPLRFGAASNDLLSSTPVEIRVYP